MLNNVLFVLYQDFTANSAVHVFHFAAELIESGLDCVVAVPEGKETIEVLGTPNFKIVEFSECRGGPMPFRDNRGPDIVHAWTPRERVRELCDALRRRYSFQQLVHLEDNEWHLLELWCNRRFEELSALPTNELDRLVPLHLSHPHRGADFLKRADGITVIIDRLRDLVPQGVPWVEIWPSADRRRFFPRQIDRVRRARLGIPEGNTVIVYAGGVHWANAREVRSLYLAAAIRSREGRPTTLVRAGRDVSSFLGPERELGLAPPSVELGYIPHTEIPDVLSLADVLIQPGRPDKFNDYRLPSKLPEFFAMGRPVILPATNLGLHVKHLDEAYVLPKADTVSIVGAISAIMDDGNLYEKLAHGARSFFEARFNWTKSAERLRSFYRAATRSQVLGNADSNPEQRDSGHHRPSGETS